MCAPSIESTSPRPYAVYLHSGLVRDRHGRPEAGPRRTLLLAATRWDVGLAMVVAGTVNLAMLLMAATTLQGCLPYSP
ncbi:hypothetical protein RHRU231_660034 [Rhodococcus ruber]|uniref:Uncharacterized protein n=1 Tax=Rhodococcus ruber TaxID=1830 RepID=A0A098BNQ9_9NOCA|nr:Manganese transport protein MntH [Rhodococcus aetherivorans]CDZ90188.1 hypothetical protein RHRU231_660034 [Rhodococcus ruber]